MDRPFPAYKGDEPYIFVSYSHQDADTVFPGIQWLRDQGFNIWYDEGISPGASWREELAESILGCDLFIILVSPRSAKADNCLKEVNYALEQDRPVLAIHVESTQLSPGLALALSDRQAIFRHELPEEEYRDKVLSGVRSHIQQSQSVETVSTPSVINTTSKPIVIGAGLIALAILAGSILLYMKPSEEVMDISSSPNPVLLGEPIVQVQSDPLITYGDRKSIAVLPFKNLSDSPDDAYFASGIHEEILLRIAKVRDLDVKSTTSVLKYTEERPALKQVARELEVGTILEGSVRRVGNRVRITVQLIDAATDSHLWAESYDRDLEDIFEIQSDVAQRIAGALQAEL
ncbi:MAG: TIR domain-containing protein, partial [Gammaproteobacteria bacterium]|nr:TIR domain-containing protein [Gammaproteobacteria bacterium]